MICCIGKARIYYKEPLGFQLKYKPPGGSWVTITANEPLMSGCKKEQGQGAYFYDVTYSSTASFSYFGTIFYFDTEIRTVRLMGPIGQITWSGANDYTQNGVNAYFSTGEGDHTIHNYNGAYPGKVEAQFISILSVDPEAPSYKFTVKGANTDNVYALLGGLDECPAVENLGCVMGEENFYDTLLPDQSPGGLVESSCFKKVTDPNNPDCFHVVLETKYKNIADKTAAPPKIRSQLYLCGLPGCPAEYEIECCPDGECDPPKCPPDTDCELDCGNFICCYKNGKVIRTIIKY